MNTTEAPTPDRHDELVPVAVLAGELDITVDKIARQHRPDIVLDDLGLRCVPAEVARQVIANEREREATKAERAARSRRRLSDITAKNTVVPRPWPNVDGLEPAELAAMAMAANPLPNGRGIPRPSSNPFFFQEGGGTFTIPADEGAR